MNINNLKFRLEQPKDYRAVENLTREAFWNNFVPGCDEHYLVHILRDADCFIKELDIVGSLDGEIAAHIMYSKAKIVAEDKSEYPVLTFGPVSVLPKYQRQGIGKAIIEYSKNIAKELGYNAIIIYGDPRVYSTAGFCAAEKYNIYTPDKTYMDALQACELTQGYLKDKNGSFVEDGVFHIDEKLAEEFDKGFEPKEKIKDLPSQKRFQEVNKLSRSIKE